MLKFHRDSPLPPTGKAERKKLIQWLQGHPLWTYPVTQKVSPDGPEESFQIGSLQECIDLEFVYVNQETGYVEDDTDTNTNFCVWVEAGGWRDLSEDPNMYIPPEGWNDDNKWCRDHALCLDCGAPDMESALIELALRVQFFYNDDGTERGEAPDHCEFERIENDDYRSTCIDAGDGYCKTCGYPLDEDVPISVVIKGRIENIDEA